MTDNHNRTELPSIDEVPIEFYDQVEEGVELDMTRRNLIPKDNDIEGEGKFIEFPSTNPILDCGSYGMRLPSMGISTRQWDDLNLDDTRLSNKIHHIIQTALDEFHCILLYTNHVSPIVSTSLKTAMISLVHHNNLKNLILVPTLPVDRIPHWIKSEDQTDWASIAYQPHLDTILNPNPTPLLMISPPTTKSKFQSTFSTTTNLVTKTYKALTLALESGRAAHVGISGYRLGLIMELQRKLKKHRYPGLSAIQVDYNIMDRNAETTSLIKYCHHHHIVILGTNPIPTTLTSTILNSNKKNVSSSIDIYRKLTKSRYSKDYHLQDSYQDNINNLVLTVKKVASNRQLDWEGVIINYIIMKGVIPLVEPLNKLELSCTQKAIGWKLTFQEMTILDETSLPVTLRKHQSTKPNVISRSLIKSNSNSKTNSNHHDIKSKLFNLSCWVGTNASIAYQNSKISSPTPPNYKFNLTNTQLSSPSPQVNVILTPIPDTNGKLLSFQFHPHHQFQPEDSWLTKLNIGIFPNPNPDEPPMIRIGSPPLMTTSSDGTRNLVAQHYNHHHHHEIGREYQVNYDYSTKSISPPGDDLYYDEDEEEEWNPHFLNSTGPIPFPSTDLNNIWNSLPTSIQQEVFLKFLNDSNENHHHQSHPNSDTDDDINNTTTTTTTSRSSPIFTMESDDDDDFYPRPHPVYPSHTLHYPPHLQHSSSTISSTSSSISSTSSSISSSSSSSSSYVTNPSHPSLDYQPQSPDEEPDELLPPHYHSTQSMPSSPSPPSHPIETSDPIVMISTDDHPNPPQVKVPISPDPALPLPHYYDDDSSDEDTTSLIIPTLQFADHFTTSPDTSQFSIPT